MRRLRSILLLGALALSGLGCGEEKQGPDSGTPADRGIFEGPITKKDPDQGPVPDWVLALREAGPREAQAPREASPADAGTPHE